MSFNDYKPPNLFNSLTNDKQKDLLPDKSTASFLTPTKFTTSLRAPVSSDATFAISLLPVLFELDRTLSFISLICLKNISSDKAKFLLGVVLLRLNFCSKSFATKEDDFRLITDLSSRLNDIVIDQIEPKEKEIELCNKLLKTINLLNDEDNFDFVYSDELEGDGFDYDVLDPIFEEDDNELGGKYENDFI